MAVREDQAFNTEKFYKSLGEGALEKYAEITGLNKNGENIDTSLLLKLIERFQKPNPIIVEVGCATGRIGKAFIERGINYFGIELHEPYVKQFRKSIPESQHHRIIQGNYLDEKIPTQHVDAILFPWSGIGDFSFEGQQKAFQKSESLLAENGRIYVDIPIDIQNRFEGYSPGPFNIDEVHDLTKMNLAHKEDHHYQTFTGRNRKIIELVSNK